MSDAKPTILAVDDAESVRRLLEVTLGKSHVVKTAPDASSALGWAQLAPPPELVLLDAEPAGMSGYELCKALRAMPGFAAVPVIFLAERRDSQALVQAFELGALDFLVKPLVAATLLLRVRGHLASLARERAAGLQGAELRIARLLRAMRAHEHSLDGKRAQRLAQYARALALAAGAREGAAELLGKAAPVHDVGKLALPPELLRNERALAGAEREQFERHAALGAQIMGEHEDALLKLARTLALTHHEHWDGSGYPGGLQGSQIPSGGRVMAIVDAFESMTAPAYGGARMSTEAAVAEIAAGAGKRFDPALAEALRKAAAEFDKIHGAYLEPAADGGADLVIGEAAAPAAAAKAGQPAAADDDIVIGAPAQARDPVDDAGLTMIGPLRLRAGASSSDQQIREAVQRAAPKAQSSQEVAALDLKLAEPSAPPAAAAPDELRRAQETLAQAQKDRASAEAALAEARAALEANKEALAKAHGELEALRGRVSELEAERNNLNARINSQSESQLQLQTTAAALGEARAELEALRGRVSELEAQRNDRDAHMNSRSESQLELQTTEAPLAEAGAELEALRERVGQLEAERDGLNARINLQSQAEMQLQEARSEAQVRINELEANKRALAEAHAELQALRGRVSELEVERNGLNARIDSHARAERQLEQAHGELEALRARVTELDKSKAALGEASRQLESRVAGAEAARSQAEVELERARIELAAETDGLRRRIDELESERKEARAELEALRAAVAQSEARLAESQAALDELERRRKDAEATLAALNARLADSLARPAVPVPAAPRPIGARLLVAFLSGALAVVAIFLLLLL